MRRKLGTLCMLLGTVLVLGALSLFVFNQYEDRQAGKRVEEILPRVMEQIQPEPDGGENETPAVLPAPGGPVTAEAEAAGAEAAEAEMAETEIDGYAYIGYVSIPALSLELPVMSEWDYTRLKTAPCRYAGSTRTDDLVICAHNYERHFGKLKNLTAGDTVYFTGMDGAVSAYEVVSLETLSSTAVEEMTDGGFDLTLFTCTYGGATRVTVRCERAAG